MPRLTAYAAKILESKEHWQHLQGLVLADPKYSNNDQIDIILGADVYALILLSGLRKGNTYEPIAQNTTLGWILSGTIKPRVTINGVSSLHCATSNSLLQLVRLFWEQEEVEPQARPHRTPEEEKCEEHFKSSHTRTHDGRYVVRLPLKDNNFDVASSRWNAVRALKYNEGRFMRNPELKKMYTEFLSQYEELEHMSKIQPVYSTERVAYLPHHGVLRELSSTTKLRVVFNGSAKTDTGTSLNEHLMTGPNLLPTLSDVLLKWRTYKNLQRILWRKNCAETPSEYQLNTVTYGLACAPYLAIRTIKQLALDEANNYPLASQVLQTEIYVDDILTGASSEEVLLEKRQQLVGLCTAGGFPLQKWASNSELLVKSLRESSEGQSAEFTISEEDEMHRILGLVWRPQEDVFSFTISPRIESQAITRRSVLSQAAQLFDPLGWLTPVTVKAKIFLQRTWLLNIDWDVPLPDELAIKWTAFYQQWTQLAEVKIPRPVICLENCKLELVGFCDASELAYSAVVYLRQCSDERVKVSLLAAKSKVAPLKQISLPRLELCGAVLLARLISHLRATLQLKLSSTHLWTDSMVTLGWIQGHPNKWTTFVANRVSEIQQQNPDALWHHTADSQNPADCASRGINPRELKDHELWWTGPTFIYEQFLNRAPVLVNDQVLPEQRSKIVLTVSNQLKEEIDLVNRVSSHSKLLRIVAWCRRWWLKHSKNLDLTEKGALSPKELEGAERAIIQQVQSEAFNDELKALTAKGNLPHRSPLLALSPFIDSHGLLRVGGRLREASLTFETKHLIILPHKSRFTQLLVEAIHQRVLHGGVQLTLTTLRQNYWIPQGRRLVKTVIHSCVTCVRWRAAVSHPVMGDLPAARVRPNRPFYFTGVDYAGPVWLRTSAGRGFKAYKAFLSIFVCLSTRAIHLEVVSSYTTQAFLAALKRFVSRRGLCAELFSDQGSNFIGADIELKRMFQELKHETSQFLDQLTLLRIKWNFNPLPPYTR